MVIVVQSSPKHHCVQYLYNAFTEHAFHGLCRICLLLLYVRICVSVCDTYCITYYIYSIILYIVGNISILCTKYVFIEH